MIDLKASFGNRYRISLDESAEIPGQTNADRAWLQQIPCRRGHIYIHGENTLGAYCDKSVTVNRLVALRFVRVHQRGDRECTVTFDPSHAEEVLQLLDPYRRRQVSDDERRRLAAMSAIHSPFRHQPG